ncbi:MAG: phosphotransferase, partial [Pseudomonadales bacterium]
MPGFPTNPETLTTDWLSATLNTSIDDFRVEHFSEGSGIIGMVTRVHLTGPGAPASVIVKFPSPSADNRAIAALYDLYGKEIRFYRDLASRIALRTPAFLGAEYDETSQEFVLVLEDLGRLRIGDQIEGCSIAEAKRIISAIAKFHADGWQPTQPDWLLLHSNPTQRDGMMGGFQLGWPVVLEKFDDLLPGSAREYGKRLPDHVGRLLDEMCQPPICHTHGDMRLDNIFFDDATDEVVFVDWQAICTSAPEHDLAYFITQSVPAEVAAANDLVGYYHEQLTGHGIEYPLDRCKERYKICALYFLCYAVVIAGTLDMGNERGRLLARTLLG